MAKLRLSSKATDCDKIKSELTHRGVEYVSESVHGSVMISFNKIAYAFNKEGAMLFPESMPVGPLRERIERNFLATRMD